MAIDLNGSATGFNYATTYREEDPAVSIAATGVKVGSGSSTSNSDRISVIRIQITGVQDGDFWLVGALPPRVVVSATETGPAMVVPFQISAVLLTTLFLRPIGPVMDDGWQTALKAVSYGTNETTGGTRTVSVSGKVFEIWADTAITTITVQPRNDAPVAVADVATAVEAGGLNNSSPGVNPTGNVLTNDTDVDAGDTKAVTAVSSYAATGTVGSALIGRFGTLLLNADGSYSYTVDNNNATVQALRTSANTLTETFTYTVRDAAGATSNATLSITIQGANDTLVGQSDTLHALEAGGVNNSTPGTNPAINLLLNDTDVDANDTKQVTNWSGSRSPYGTAVAFVSGEFTFTVNNTNAAVQALRTYDDTLTVDYWVNIRDAAGATSGEPITVVIHGANDAPLAVADVATAVEAGGLNNSSPGVNPTGNVLTNDTDVDAGDTKAVTAVSSYAATGTVGSALVGRFGTLLLNADGSYSYTVDNNNASVQSMHTRANTLTETFTYTVGDASGAQSVGTLSFTIEGKNDTPETIALGQVFSGNSASVVTGDPLGAYRDFSFELTVTPRELITLQAQSLTGAAGTTSQHYALSPIHGSSTWGNTNHVGVGLSVGTNGISVYQHTESLLSPLLTWTGSVGVNTHVAVNVIDNRPLLYVDGQLVATGLQSNKLLHPPTEVGGINGGYFKGSIHDVLVWNGALTWNNGVAMPRDSLPLYSAATLSVKENTVAGTVITTLRSGDVDAGDTWTYSLVDDGGGRFVINGATGVVSIAPGAVLDHEALASVTLRARVTDTEGLFQEISFTVQIADINEAPSSTYVEAFMNEDNQVRLDASRAEDMLVDGVAVPAVRIDSLPGGGVLTLNNQIVVVGQIMAATDAAHLKFKPNLFSDWASTLSDPDSGDKPLAIRIETLPTAAQGQLLFDGEPINAETAVIMVADFHKLSFEPELNYNGDTVFTFRALDSRGRLQEGEPSSFTIHIRPVNDTPVIAPTLNIDVREGASTRLTGLVLDDVDALGGDMAVTLRVDEGTLNAASTSGVTVEGSGTQTLKLRGTLTDLNGMLAQEPGVQYQSVHHEPPAMSATVERLSPQGVDDPVVKMKFTTTDGAFDASVADGITLRGNNTRELEVEGLASKVGQYVTEGGVVRQVPLHMARLTVKLDDLGETGIDPGLTGGADNEQDTRVIGLSLVPQGLPLNAPELDEHGGNAAGPEPTGSVSAQTLAGVAIGAPLVIGIGLFDKIKNMLNAGTAEETAASQLWMSRELGEAAHVARGDVRHSWLQFVNLAAGTSSIPAAVAPGVVTAVTVTTIVVVASNQSSPEQAQVNQRPDVTGPDSIDGQEDRSLKITGLNFNDADAGDGTVRVTFELPPDRGALEATATSQVQVLGNFSQTLTLIGTLTAINAFVSGVPGVQFLPDADVHGRVDLKVTINDLGNTGTDPGTSGDATSEEKSILVSLEIAPISDAPEGHDSTLKVEYDASAVLNFSHLGFADIDQDSFVGIQITELPANGQLLLGGQPVLVDAVITAQMLASGEVVFVPDSAVSGASHPSRLGFRVLDSGSAENGGQTIAAHPSFLTFDVQYPPVLEAVASNVAFNEADGQALHWMQGAKLGDRNDPAQAISTVWIDAHGFAFGDRWGFDPVWLASVSPGGVRPFEQTNNGGGNIIRFTNGATQAFVQELLDALVFEVEAPNATEGMRSFTITVEDVDGRSSAPVDVALAVTSILDSLVRELQANERVVQQRATLALPPTAEQSAADAQAVLAFLQSKSSLAQAVWQTLAEAVVADDGGLKVGTSLDLALQALGLGNGKSLISDMTPPNAQAFGEEWFTSLIRDPATKTLWLPAEQRTALLAWVEEQRAGSQQLAGAQFVAAIDSPSAIVLEGEEPAWRIPAGAWLINASPSMTGLAPLVVEAADPWEVWQTQPQAWVVDAQGALSLSNSAWQQLRMAVDVQHHVLQNRNGAVELLALNALQEAMPQHNHWLVDARLAGWLTATGLNITIQVDIGDGSQPWLTTPNAIVQTPEGLRMSPTTCLKLQEQLLEQLDAPDAEGSPGMQLFQALAASIDAGGAPELPAEARAWLQMLGLGVRWVEGLDPDARPGEIAQSAADQPLVMTKGTRDSLYAQLLAREAAQSGNEPVGPVGSDLLQVKRALEAAQESTVFTGLHSMQADEVVMQWLSASGMSAVKTTAYQELDMTDALARLVARKDVVVFDPATQTLHLSDAVFNRLGAMAGLALAQSLQVEAEAGPLAPLAAVHSLTFPHEAALQLGPQLAPAGDTSQAWAFTFAGLRLLAGTHAQDLPSLENPVSNTQRLNEALSEDVVQILAKAGIAVRDLGRWEELDEQGQTALRDGTQPSIARDAWGQPFMDSTILETLKIRLLAQSCAEQAELARSAIGDLMTADTGASVPVISAGMATTQTPHLFGSPGFLIQFDASLLVTLQRLGISPLSIEVVDGYLAQEQLESLEQEAGYVVVDRRSGTAWAHQDTQSEWFFDLANRMQADHVARYTLDPGAITDLAHTDDPVGMAYRVSLTGPDAVAWTSTAVASGLVRISIDLATLNEAHLAFRWIDGFEDNAFTHEALRAAQLGTVMTEPGQPGSVVMTEATWDALLTQSAHIQHSEGSWPTDPQTMGLQLMKSLHAQAVLEGGIESEETARAWVDLDAHLLPTLQAAGLNPFLLGELDTLDATALELLDNAAGTYATTGSYLMMSSATLALWKEGLADHANQLGSPVAPDLAWLQAEPSVIQDDDVLNSHQTHWFQSIETQLGALLVDGGRELISTTEGPAAFWHIDALDGRLDIHRMRNLLEEAHVNAFTWIPVDPDSPASFSALNAGGAIAGEAPDGSLYFSDTGYPLATELLQVYLQDARDELAQAVFANLLDASDNGDWYSMPRGTLLHDLHTLLPDSFLHEVPGRHPRPGEIGIDDMGRIWMHGATRLQVLNAIGKANATDDPVESEALIAILNQATAHAGLLGVYSIDGGAAGLLANAGFALAVNGSFSDSLLGYQNLGDAGSGALQLGADGRIYLTQDTLITLQALAGGQATALAMEQGDVVTSVQLLNYLSELANNTVLALHPQPAANAGLEAAELAWWQHLRSWVVLDGPDTQTDGLSAQVGLPDDILAVLSALSVPVIVLQITSDDALLAALQSGELNRSFTIIEDAAGNRLISPDTRERLLDWITAQVARTTGMDWREQYGLDQDPDAAGGTSKRALLNQQQTNTTVDALYLDTGTVMNAVLNAQSAGNDTVRLNISSDALQNWLLNTGKLGLQLLNLTQVANPTTVGDGQFAEDATELAMTRATAERLLGATRDAASALTLDSAMDLIQQISSRSGYTVNEKGYIVINATDALRVVADSLGSFQQANVQDIAGNWNEVRFEDLARAQEDLGEADDSTAFLAASRNVTLSNGSVVTVRNGALIDAVDKLSESGQLFVRNADGDWVVSEATRVWLLGESAELAAHARSEPAEQLDALLQAGLSNGTYILPRDEALALLGHLQAPYLLTTHSGDLGLPMRVVDLGNGTLQISLDTGSTLKTLSNTGIGTIQSQLATLNEAEAIYNDAELVQRYADVDLLSALAFEDTTSPGKLMVSVALDASLWDAFGKGAAGSTQLPNEGPLSAAGQTNWNGLYPVGEVKAFTDDQGQYRYLMTTETWSTLLAERAKANPAGGARAVVHLTAEQVADANLSALSGLTVVDLAGLTNASASDLLSFSSASAMLGSLPAATVLRDSDGGLWMTTATVNAARASLRAHLLAESGLSSPASDGHLLAQRLQAHDEARVLLAAANTPDTIPGSTKTAHQIDAATLLALNELGINVQQVAGTDPLVLESQPILSFVIDANGAVWISNAAHAQIKAFVETVGHGLNADLYSAHWEAVPGQDLRVLNDIDQHFDLILQRAELGLVPGTNFADLANPNTYTRDAQGRVYVSEATYQTMAPALERAAFTERAAFQEAVQAGLQEAEVSAASTVVLVTDQDLIARIIANPNARELTGNFAANNLSGDERQELADPGQYHFAQSPDGVLIGQAQLLALSNLTSGGIGPVETSDYRVIDTAQVVSSDHPLLAQWLEQLGHRLGVLRDGQGQPIASQDLSPQALDDAERAQLEEQPGLIVQGADGVLLMSQATWQQVMTRSMIESTTAQTALAQHLQLELSHATSQELPNGQLTVTTLPGSAQGWLEAFDSLGISYRLVDALGTATDPNAIDASALAGQVNGNGLVVGLDSVGRLVMSQDTWTRLSEATGEFGDMYSMTGLQLQALGHGYTSAEALPMGENNVNASLLGDWQGGAAGVRLMYGTITAIRSLMNSELASDGVLKGQLSNIAGKVAEYSTGELRDLIDQNAFGLPEAQSLQRLAGWRRLIHEKTDPVDFLEPIGRDHEGVEMQRFRPIPLQDLLETAMDIGDLSRDLNSIAVPAADDSEKRAGYSRELLAAAALLRKTADTYLQQNLAMYEERVEEIASGEQIAVLTPRFNLETARHIATATKKALADLQMQYRPVDLSTLSDAQLTDIRTTVTTNAARIRKLFTDKLETRLQESLDDKVGSKLVADHIRAVQESPEYKNYLALEKASNAFQLGRLYSSYATYGIHTPAALADATNSYRLMNSVYAETDSGKALQDKYWSQGGIALSNMVGAIFSAAQLPTWKQFKTPADLQKYWTDFQSSGTYSGDGFVLHPKSGGLPMQKIYKSMSIEMAGQDKVDNSKLGLPSNVQPNIAYQGADLGTVATSIAMAWLWSHQDTRYSDYMVARNSLAAFSGVLLAAGDAGGSGVLAYLWQQVKGKLHYGDYLYNTASAGGRMVAGAQGILAFGLVSTDLATTAGLYSIYGEASGIGWGGVADAVWAAGAVGWSTYAINHGYSALWALAPTFIKVDLSSVQNMIRAWPLVAETWQEGRSVEFNLVARQFGMDAIKATPIVNYFGGILGLGEAVYGLLAAGTTVEQFKTAVQQRLQAQEDHPHEGTMARSQLVLQHALKMGTADHTFDISNSIDDFSFALNSNVKVMKSVVVSEIVDGVADSSPEVRFLSDAQTIGVASGNNLTGQHVIEVDLANTTGKLATYVIRPDATMVLTDIGLEVQGPLMLIDASGSTVDSTNQFFVYNPNVAIHGGQGEDVYLLAESLRPQVSNVDGTRLVAGYIRDGIVSAGRDAVSWMLAASSDEATSQGHSIHMGTGAEGFAAYRGIQHFFGSGFNDVITRYGDSSSRTMVSVKGGGGHDVFDLRSGNNHVTVSAGEVYFNRTGLAEAVEVNRDTLSGQGQYTNGTRYGALFANRFDAKNINVVTIEQADTGLTKVFGHQDASEVVSVNFGASGLHAQYKTGTSTEDGTSFINGYELSAITQAVPGEPAQLSLRGLADDKIDVLFGTVHDDTIVIGNGAKLKQVHGGGGNDSIDVDVAGIGVYLTRGDSLVRLGANTSGATLVLGEGNEARIDTQTGSPGNAVNVTVFGGVLLDTYVDASNSTELLNVSAQSGKSTIALGFGASEIRVSESASTVKVIDSQANSAATLKFLLEDTDGFSINDFVTADGRIGAFKHTVENGANVYSTNWFNAYGDFTVLQYQGDDTANVSFEVAGSTYQLFNLIPHVPEPAPA